MAVEAAQGLAHHVDRHDAGDDRVLFAQARGERGIEPLGRHVQLVAQGFGGLLQLAEIIAIGLDQVAHALDRVGLEARAFLAVGHLRRRQRLALARLGIGRIEPLQRMGDAGAELGEIAQLLLRQIDLPEQRIGEDLVELGEEAVLVGGGEIAQVEVIGFRQPQQDLRGDRALVALDQVDVARRNPEPLGDLGLRQRQLLADAPETGADKEFFTGVGGHRLLPHYGREFASPLPACGERSTREARRVRGILRESRCGMTASLTYL